MAIDDRREELELIRDRESNRFGRRGGALRLKALAPLHAAVAHHPNLQILEGTYGVPVLRYSSSGWRERPDPGKPDSLV